MSCIHRPGSRPPSAPARDVLYCLRLRMAPCCEEPQAPQCGSQRHARAKEVEESGMAVPNHHAFRIRPHMRRGLCTEVPLPTRLVSNEEVPPHPQTAAQQEG